MLLLALGQPPCLPDELGRHWTPEPAPPSPPAAAAPAPAPAAPPLPAPMQRQERARYSIGYGLLGTVAEITLESLPGAKGAPTVLLTGKGSGSILGLGHTEKAIETEFNTRTLDPRRWKNHRKQGGKVITDFATQEPPGKVALVRQRPDKPETRDVLERKSAVLDPLAFLARLRIAPPTGAPQTFEVLDGRGLWFITINPATRTSLAVATGNGAAPAPTAALKLDGRAQPVYWDGDIDHERQARAFTIWLSDDVFHTPLRLAMPYGIGEVRVELVSLSRALPPGVRGFPPLSLRAISRWLASMAAVRSPPTAAP